MGRHHRGGAQEFQLITVATGFVLLLLNETNQRVRQSFLSCLEWLSSWLLPINIVRSLDLGRLPHSKKRLAVIIRCNHYSDPETNLYLLAISACFVLQSTPIVDLVWNLRNNCIDKKWPSNSSCDLLDLCNGFDSIEYKSYLYATGLPWQV